MVSNAQVKQLQDRIVETAVGLFGSYGVKTVTMDDIADNCGISSKTLNRFFENKYELLQVIIADIHVRLSQELHLLQDSENAVEEVLRSLPFTLKIFRDINYRMLVDLEKYHFEIWRKVDAFRQQVILDFIRVNLQRGVHEGFFSDEMDLDVIASMRLQQLIQLHNLSAANPSNMEYVLFEVTHHYLSGMATEKGREEIMSRITSHHTDQLIFN